MVAILAEVTASIAHVFIGDKAASFVVGCRSVGGSRCDLANSFVVLSQGVAVVALFHCGSVFFDGCRFSSGFILFVRWR